ncbi:MAG: type II toxin-antitoxin system RelB/DinJ family antitoxin [Clostridia bacterium]|nr:type II toxin-antitoxin system RelB/DinJ family antitoxin [Clostridia bacterium]
MATTNLNVRIDEKLKKDAEALFADLGLSLSSAITLFLKACVDYNGIPFEIKKTNRAPAISGDILLQESQVLIDTNIAAYKELSK